MIHELVEIMANLTTAVQNGELTQAEAVDLLDAFQEHEFEAIAEHVIQLPSKVTLQVAK
jgi:hypothetical protein